MHQTHTCDILAVRLRLCLLLCLRIVLGIRVFDDEHIQRRAGFSVDIHGIDVSRLASADQ